MKRGVFGGRRRRYNDHRLDWSAVAGIARLELDQIFFVVEEIKEAVAIHIGGQVADPIRINVVAVVEEVDEEIAIEIGQAIARVEEREVIGVHVAVGVEIAAEEVGVVGARDHATRDGVGEEVVVAEVDPIVGVHVAVGLVALGDTNIKDDVCAAGGKVETVPGCLLSPQFGLKVIVREIVVDVEVRRIGRFSEHENSAIRPG
jgi:hypothetical protein